MKTLRETIIEYVQHNSGGVKFLDLIMHIVHQAAEGHVKLTVKLEQMEEYIESLAPDVRILRYGWDMGGVQREKLFIYTPLWGQ